VHLPAVFAADAAAHALLRAKKQQTSMLRKCPALQTDVPPFVEGGFQYTDLALQWGAQYGVGVWLDFHAANGSQNGYGPQCRRPCVRVRVCYRG